MSKQKQEDDRFYGGYRYTNHVVRRVTSAVRRADDDFERSGGSSRHWVVECFLPALSDFGIDVVLAAQDNAE